MANYFPFVHSLPLQIALIPDFTGFEDYSLSLFPLLSACHFNLSKGKNKELEKVFTHGEEKKNTFL